MTERTTLALIFGCLCVVAGAKVAAQPSVISGRVHVSGDTARPVIDAELTLLPGLRIVRSDSTGGFRFTDVRPGTYTLRARRVGFEVFTQEVSVLANQERLTVGIPMRIGAQILAQVTVSGRPVMFPARLAEPYARVARGRGAFFTRELIDSLQPWDISSLLQRVAGVRVNDRVIKVARCAGGGANSGSDGPIQVYVDGVRQTNYSNNFLGRGALEAVRDVAIDKVQLIEVHTSMNSIPPEFAADACAVILIWSK